MKIITAFFCFLILISSVNSAFSLTIEPEPPFEVYTIEDLITVGHRSNVSSVMLMNDLEITDEIWRPIGRANRPFNGTFDGNNYTITFKEDVHIIPAPGSENFGCGLFGYVRNGRIRDLNVVFQGNLTSFENNTGALVGVLNSSSYSFDFPSIIDCSVSSNRHSVSGKNNVGGLVGYVINGSIENSSADCLVVSSGNNAGGLVGQIHLGSIFNASATGSVKSETYAGALVGYVSNTTAISSSSADGTVKPKGEFGNFVGGWDENYKPEVFNCLYQGTHADLDPVPHDLEPIPSIYCYDNKYRNLATGLGIIILIAAAVILYFKKRK
jgi:The GLUG motif.